MDLDRVRALSYIAPETNVCSICSGGILSHRQATCIRHESIALESVQEIRACVRVPCPDGRSEPLHSYANLYFCPRNPMMFRRVREGLSLCVVEIRPDIMRTPGTIITDRNAAKNLVRFAPFPEGLAMLDETLVYARYWTHDDPIEQERRKAIKCAEVLVPDRVPAEFVSRVLVPTEMARLRVVAQLVDTAPHLQVEVDGDVFFQP